MKLKQTIEDVKQRLHDEKHLELEKILLELEKADREITENNLRNKIVEEIKEKNDHIDWVYTKDV